MDVVFLDANVLFSAAYRPTVGLRRLWNVPSIRLITSGYTVVETYRNLATPQQRDDLATLLRMVAVISTAAPVEHPLLATVPLPTKDRPVLLAAIHANATHLLTGDRRHFGAYYEQRIAGVLILPPAAYLQAIHERAHEER